MRFEFGNQIWEITASDVEEQIQLQGRIFRPIGWYCAVPWEADVRGPFATEEEAVAAARASREKEGTR